MAADRLLRQRGGATGAPAGRRLPAGALAAGVFTGVAVLLALPVWAHPGTTLLGGMPDTPQAAWFLAWVPHAIAHAWSPLTTGHLDSPYGVNLMWNVATPLPALLLAPVTEVWGPVAAYDVFVVSGLAVSGFAAFLLARRHVRRSGAAMVAGVAYMLSPFVMGHAEAHGALTFAAGLPLTVLVVEDVLRGHRSPRAGGLMLGGLAAVQLLVHEEVLATGGVALAVLLATLAVMRRDALTAGARRMLVAGAWAVPVMAAVGTWPLLVQFGAGMEPAGPVQPPGMYVTDLLNLVVPSGLQLVAPASAAHLATTFTGEPAEWTGYLGVPLIAALVVVVVRLRSRLDVRVAAVALVVAAVLSLGPSLHVGGHDTGVPLPWAALAHLPLLGDVVPARFTKQVDLAAAILVALLVDEALEMTPRRRRMVLALGSAGLLCAAPALPLAATTVRAPQFFRSDAVRVVPEDSVVLVAPFPTGVDPWPMYWQAESGMRFRMPGGYVNRYQRTPTGASTTARVLVTIEAGRRTSVTPGERDAMRAEWRRWGVAAVVLGPMAHRGTAGALLAGMLGPPDLVEGGVTVWRGSPALTGAAGTSVPPAVAGAVEAGARPNGWRGYCRRDARCDA